MKLLPSWFLTWPAWPSSGCLRRVHSRYRRQLADTASGGQQVLIDLQARRLFCKNGACTKPTFAEQTPSHLGKPCNQGRRWHDSVVSVQVVCPEYRAVLLVMH